jgi:hypothetical protein
MARITSGVTDRATPALRRSTVGDSPETVIVSSRVPTFSSALMVAVKFAGSSILSRLTVLNPGSVNVTL